METFHLSPTVVILAVTVVVMVLVFIIVIPTVRLDLKNQIGRLQAELDQRESENQQLRQTLIEEQEKNRKLESVAYVDPLVTSVGSRGFWDNQYAIVTKEAGRVDKEKRCAVPVALCFIDLDGFKPVNDCYGHQAGDQVLVEVGKAIKSQLRTGDVAARFGGDEFVVLLSGVTKQRALAAANDILRKIASLRFGFDPFKTRQVTASIGVAYAPDWEDRDELIKKADQAMYEAKHSFRGNNVRLYKPPKPPEEKVVPFSRPLKNGDS